jgi:flagellar protein FlaG
MSIPALPSSTAFGIPVPVNTMRPAADARAASESRTTSESDPIAISAAGETRDRSQLETARPIEETAKTDKAEQEAKQKELEEAVKKLNEQLKPVNPSVRFNVDDESGKLVIQLMDTRDDTVIRQIPSEEAIKLSREPDLKRSGLLLDTKA